MACPIDETTPQGYDMQFGTNVIGQWKLLYLQLPYILTISIGHYYLTELLMPTLLAVAASEQGEKARVVTTSDIGNYLATLTWDSFVDGPKRRSMDTMDLYNQSKHVCSSRLFDF